MIARASTFLGPNGLYQGKVTGPSLVLFLDAGNTQSYPGTGSTWYDLSTYHNDGIFNSTPTYSNMWNGSLGFDGLSSSNYVFFDKKTLTFDGSSYNVTTGTNSVTPTVGSWVNGAWSVESYSGKIKLKYQLGGDPSSGTICGFSENPLAGGNSYDRIKYGFYTKAESPLSIWEGNEVYTVSGTFSSFTVFSIVYDLSKIKYYIDNVLVYTSLNPLPTNPLYLYSTFQNNSIVNIEFGPYVEAIPIGDSKYTIEAWVQSNTTDTTNGGIIGWGTYGENYHVNALRYSGAGGFTNYWWGDDYSTPNLSMTSSLYYHVVAKYDGTNRQIWVNGTVSTTDSPGATNSVDTFSNLTVGVSNTLLNEYLDGSIGYLKLYNKSLSDAQIVNSFNSTKERFGYVYGSFLFNDSNQYLSNSSIDYSFGTNDYTMEAFFNHTTSTHSENGLLSLRTSGGDGVGINLINSDSTPAIEFYASGTPYTFTASNDTWYHVAMSRVSGTTSFYVNGNLFTQVEDTTNYAQTDLVIGRYYSDLDNYYYNGIISNVRVTPSPVDSNGIYTSNFTPPTTPLGATAGTRLLLLAQENMLVSDSSGKNEIVLNNNVVGWTSSLPSITYYVTENLQFYVDAGLPSSYPGTGTTWYDISGNSRNLTMNSLSYSSNNGGYIIFDGSHTAHSVATYSINFSNGFTVECVAKFSGSGLEGLFAFNTPMNYINVQVQGDNIRWEVDPGSSFTTTNSLTSNTWYHVTCVYEGDSNKTSATARIYINGVENNTSSLLRSGQNQTSNFVLGECDDYLTGNIALSRMYNKVLSPSEVLNNFNYTKDRFGL